MVRKALGMCIVDRREVRSIACIEIQSVRELAKQKWLGRTGHRYGRSSVGVLRLEQVIELEGD